MSGSSTPTGVRLPATTQQATQVSTTTLLNALHTSYTSGQPFRLDASTTLVVNTWLTALNPNGQGQLGGTMDTELVRQAWEHCRRRAEDGCILLGSLHASTPSLLLPTISTLPLEIPQTMFAALNIIKAFTNVVTPHNSSIPKYSSLAATFSLSLTGQLVGASLAISTTGLDTSSGLLDIPPEAGYRAFDVFYYLLTAASTPAEREFLGLKHPSQYSLLNPSGTYQPPSYLPTADDLAAAEDFRQCLKAVGIKGSAHRNLLSTLAALLKLGDTTALLVDDDVLESVCEDVGGLLSIDPEVLLHKCKADERKIMIAGVYEALVDWVLAKSNAAIAAEIHHVRVGDSSSESSSDGIGAKTPDTDEDTVNISVLEIPGHDLGRAVALRGVFDDGTGINAEMKEDGIEVVPAGTSVIREMENAISNVTMDLGIPATAAAREREYEHERQLEVLEKLGVEADEDGFLKNILNPVDGEGIQGALRSRLDISHRIGSSRVWYHLSLHPTDESPGSLASLASTTSAWSAGTVSRQLRTWRLPEWANRRNKNLDFTADFELHEFHTRYARLGCQDGRDGVESWLLERGWSNGEVIVGHDRVWMREGPWWEAESLLDVKNEENPFAQDFGMESGYSRGTPGPNDSSFFPPVYEDLAPQENLTQQRQGSVNLDKIGMSAPSVAPTQARTINTQRGDYGLGAKGDYTKGVTYEGDIGEFTGELDPEIGEPKAIISQPISKSRRFWVGFVWALTFWIPSFTLRYIGRMKRPDIRFAWREKVVLVLLIFLLNATVIFYIIEFGRLLCPNFDKAWNEKEVGFHTGDNDWWVSYRGGVYDLSKFWKTNHATVQPAADRASMEPFAGLNMDNYIVPPLKVACPYLVKSDFTHITFNDTTLTSGVHRNGEFDQPDPKNPMHSDTWYFEKFLPKMETFYKGDLVYTKKTFVDQGLNQDRQWVRLNDKIYDFTQYYTTLKTYNNDPAYSFIPEDVSDVIKSNPGADITSKWPKSGNFSKTLPCMDHIFYKGKVDFRDTPKCQVNNYILLAFTIVLCAVILTKFLAALQLGSKRRPAAQDKFVICQVPAYTEGEDQLRKGLDSLTALQYDNKRKLLCVICDGMIVGGGNDRPTPKIVLDILGVDPKTDPVALPFKSVGQGSEQLNYGKVYSGLYEYEGNVVPYIVVVKVGKQSEQTKTKPGNRGKRDSQILLLSFLNRVHHRAPMSPLELEMFHQINNIIGVDPELYEYLLMVDADTSVKEDSLNRLVAGCANDAKIAGICGETSLENEERSWWTMIQVYEYYISHHLAKAFESLFGSVTCLPGCFSMYRLRTADKGRPLIISQNVINDYSTCDVDTLHKKNLLALGEDRYLTTLMTKYFPSMSYKFIPDAYASTAAPDTWSVLLSQRRRWINSTIHNLAELVWLKDLCGFCCFSMRFVVFIDLFGTIILPATCAYLGYLIYRVATHSGQFPLISIIMIAAVYGLQAVIFIIRRQWQHVGWMIIYILAFPIYSFVLPIFSFWSQDDFSWGSTRIVIGEKGNKQVVAIDDEGFDPRTVPLQRWDDYALSHGLPGRRGYDETEKPYQDHPSQADYEMDDVQSTYSYAKPASTVLSGFRNKAGSTYLPPMSPAPFSQTPRQSDFGGYKDQPQYQPVRDSRTHSRMQSFGGMSDHYAPSQHLQNPFDSRASLLPGQSTDNLMIMQSPPLRQARGSPSPLGFGTPNPMNTSRPVSMIDFRGNMPGGGPSDQAISQVAHEVMAEIELEATTKRTMKALVEQRLQTELVGEKKAYLDKVVDEILQTME